jgi:BlaI family penicillinase repressor
MATPPDLGALQLAVLRVLWRKTEASAAEIHAALGRNRDIALTTVSTILTRLDRRGVVAHRAEGRTFIYRAKLTEPEVRRSSLRSMVNTLFSGDPTAVVSQLLASRDISPGDLDRMRKMIDENSRQSKKGRE